MAERVDVDGINPILVWKRIGMLAASMGSCPVILHVVKMRLMFFAAYRTAPVRNDIATDGERVKM